MIFLLCRFEEIGSSNGLQDEDEEEDDDHQPSESDGIIRTTRKKKAPKEHVGKANFIEIIFESV
jgi:hypothetical protein